MKLWLPSKCFRGSSQEPCEVGQGLRFPDGETEAQRRVMTCQTENMASPILGALYPAIPTLDMLHELLVTHSSSFSTSPSAAGDRARAGQRQQQSLGSFTPVPKTTPHPKGSPSPKAALGCPGHRPPAAPHQAGVPGTAPRALYRNFLPMEVKTHQIFLPAWQPQPPQQEGVSIQMLPLW